MKNVQIPYDLFMALLRYHLVEDGSCADEIRRGLEKKLDSMVRHELYAKYKTAPTEEEREKARKEYLDKRGVPDNVALTAAVKGLEQPPVRKDGMLSEG